MVKKKENRKEEFRKKESKKEEFRKKKYLKGSKGNEEKETCFRD